MFKRSFVFTVLIFCVFSFFFTNNIAEAGRLSTWEDALTLVNNAKEIMDEETTNYHYIQDDLEKLIGEWNDAEISNDNQMLLAVIATAGAIVSIASAGSLSSLYPAAYVLSVTAAKVDHHEETYNIQKSAYLTSMGATVASDGLCAFQRKRSLLRWLSE